MGETAIVGVLECVGQMSDFFHHLGKRTCYVPAPMGKNPGNRMVKISLRVPSGVIEVCDQMVFVGMARNRSDAIRRGMEQAGVYSPVFIKANQLWEGKNAGK